MHMNGDRLRTAQRLALSAKNFDPNGVGTPVDFVDSMLGRTGFGDRFVIQVIQQGVLWLQAGLQLHGNGEVTLARKHVAIWLR